MMNSVEMHLPVITMLVRVEVAAPEVKELENGSEAQLLVEVEDMFTSGSLGEFPSVTRKQPILVIGDLTLVGVLLLYEIRDDLYDQIVGKSVEV